MLWSDENLRNGLYDIVWGYCGEDDVAADIVRAVMDRLRQVRDSYESARATPAQPQPVALNTYTAPDPSLTIDPDAELAAELESRKRFQDVMHPAAPQPALPRSDVDRMRSLAQTCVNAFFDEDRPSWATVRELSAIALKVATDWQHTRKEGDA